jgi:hypothetical protein
MYWRLMKFRWRLRVIWPHETMVAVVLALFLRAAHRVVARSRSFAELSEPKLCPPSLLPVLALKSWLSSWSRPSYEITKEILIGSRFLPSKVHRILMSAHATWSHQPSYIFQYLLSFKIFKLNLSAKLLADILCIITSWSSHHFFSGVKFLPFNPSISKSYRWSILILIYLKAISLGLFNELPN